MSNCEKSKYFDFLGLSLMILISFGYMLLGRSFSELHIQFSFLDFPVFIGEILLFICLLLFLAKYRVNPAKKITKGHYAIAAYFVFVIAKAASGYLKWGTLAFRHAALFYYPLFAIFGYFFFRRDYFEKKEKFLAFFIVLVFLLSIYKEKIDWSLPCFILALILVCSFRNRAKYLFLALLFLRTPFESYVHTSRAMMVGFFASLVYLLASGYFISKFNRKLKWALIGFIVLFVMVVMYKFSSRNSIRSLVDFKSAIEGFNRYGHERDKRLLDYKPAPLGVKLYHSQEADDYTEELSEKRTLPEIVNVNETLSNSPSSRAPDFDFRRNDKPSHEVSFNLNSHLATKLPEIKRVDPTIDIQNTVKIREAPSSAPSLSVIDQVVENTNRVESDRSFEKCVGNIIFRLFIWQDMFSEYFRSKSLFGFDFGKPLRSPSLEVMVMASGEWERDGWIEAHNSYFNAIYRAGIIGLLYVYIIFFNLFLMAKFFVKSGSWIGVLLSIIAIQGLVAANFMPILELPYSAIPLWSVYGIALGYYKSLATLPKSVENQSSLLQLSAR